MKKFQPKSGQVDFTNARFAPVINCVVKNKNKILIVQRSKSLNFYPEFWSGVSGFLDDSQKLKQKVENEIKEELGIDRKNIISIKLGNIFHQEAPKYKKTWIVHPILVKVKTNKIKLDWEAQDCRWIKFQDAKKFKLLPGFDRVLEEVKKIEKK